MENNEGLQDEGKENASEFNPEEFQKNLKGEMGRKFQNIEEKLNQFSDSQSKLLEFIENTSQKQPETTANESITDLMYSDPDRFAEEIQNKAYEKFTKAQAEKEKVMTQKTTVLNKLVNDFPELRNEQSDLTQKAAQLMEAYSATEQNNPHVIKQVVLEAAMDLGVKPRSKRIVDEDDFTLSGGSSSSTTSRKSKSSDEIDPRTLAYAEKSGLDINDPKLLARLKQYSKKNFYSKFK